MNNGRLARREVTLLETLDRLLNRGVVVAGDLTLSVADVDLVHLGLRLLLASVETAADWRLGRASGTGWTPSGSVWPGPGHGFPVSASPAGRLSPASRTAGPRPRSAPENLLSELDGEPARLAPALPGRINTDPAKVEHGLAKLVLTLVDLVRRLMERQALRRTEAGSLTPDEIERMGVAFLRLEQKMVDLRAHFGLSEEDLNLSLGPLGDLM